MKRKWSVLMIMVAVTFGAMAQSNEVKGLEGVKNRAFKIDPFSPMTGKLTLGYEQVMLKNITLDVDLGFIGPDPFGYDEGDSRGVFLKAGPRLYTNPDFYTDDLKRFSDFQGLYFMPTLGYSYFTYTLLDDLTNLSTERATQQSLSIILNLGRQWVFGGVAVLDVAGGIGYGFASQEERIRNYSHLGNNFVGSFTIGIGILTK